VLTRSDGDAGLQAARAEMPDLVLCDLKIPGINGLEVLARLKQDNPSLPFIMITGYGSVEVAVEAMKLGAVDFILKPFDIDAVKLAVRRALGFEKLKDEVRFWRQEAWQIPPRTGLIGSSEGMRELLGIIEQVAATPATVLISGESGTGKELVAQAIHGTSPRREQPLIKVNCGSLPEALLESELFGHEKGVFPGAVARKLGRFERADQGTIFLDEIDELAPAMQLRLLRVLQEKEFERVGGSETIKVDVRVIAATSRDLAAEIKNGRFREDLFYRLNVIPIKVPPLRERKEDIPELAVFFAARFAGELGKGVAEIAEEAMAFLRKYDWPGNIRELKNVMERAVILNTQPVIIPDLLPPEILRAQYAGERSTVEQDFVLPERGIDLEAVEQSLIQQALEKSEGNQTKAARLLGISRYTLIYRMEKYGLK
jgi:DNA-binding NtrC family response regulator